jgi:hypothetical protein
LTATGGRCRSSVASDRRSATEGLRQKITLHDQLADFRVQFLYPVFEQKSDVGKTPDAEGIAGGPKTDGLKQQIEAGQYPGIVKTTLDGVNQRDYLEGNSAKSARDYLFYFSGSTTSAVRYKNWKMYYIMSQPRPAGWIMPLIPYHFTLVQNIKRDPFEQAVGTDQKTAMSMGGAIGAPMTAFQYDLEYAAHRSATVDAASDVVREVPAAAGAGELQPQSGLGAGQESQRRPRERLGGLRRALCVKA